jgi:site-specific DNA-cytosine methylase
MKLLELFSGTGSVGKAARFYGFEVVSLDRDMDANIKTDIMDWDYREFPPQHFDVIWASPPCTEYSRAKTVGVRKIDESNAIVLKVLEIIQYLDPIFFIIENPQSGLLKDQYFMNDIPYDDVDDCKYGIPYRKRTRLWNIVYGWVPKSLCKRDCDSFENGKHKEHAQRGPSGKKKHGTIK